MQTEVADLLSRQVPIAQWEGAHYHNHVVAFDSCYLFNLKKRKKRLILM